MASYKYCQRKTNPQSVYMHFMYHNLICIHSFSNKNSNKIEFSCYVSQHFAYYILLFHSVNILEYSGIWFLSSFILKIKGNGRIKNSWFFYVFKTL